MAFDADKFTAAAKQAGYSDEDIQSEIQRQTKNINAATGQEFGKAGEAAVQGQAQQWRDQGSPMPGTKAPEDIRSLGSQLFDWASTPAGNAVLGVLGLAGAAAAGLGIKDRMKRPEAAPRVEPYVAPSYDFETTAREVPDRAGLPQPSTPAPQAAAPAPTAPAPAPTGIPQPTPPVAMPGAQQPQMQYGETKINAPTGVPNPVAPPAEVAPAPVAPLTDKQRREKAMADLAEHRLEEAKKASAAAEVKRAETKIQESQGKAFNNQDNTIISNQKEMQAKAALNEQGVKKFKPAPVASVAPPVVAPETSVAPVTPAPQAEPVQTTTKTQKIPGTESWLQGTWGKKTNPERAATLVDNLKNSLPEGEKLSFPVGPDGKSLGGMPSREHVLKFTNDLLGTSMDEKAFKEFRFTEENLAKMHDSLLEKIKNAPTPEAAAKLQKGFATLSAMAATAGVALGGLALYGAYKKAKAGEYGEAAKLGIPAATGLVSPAIGGLTGAAAEPSSAAAQLRKVAPILGTFADVANQKVQQYLKKPQNSVPPPR